MTRFLQKKEEMNPFTFMRRITEEMDRAFGFQPGLGVLPQVYPALWTPEIEVFEREGRFFVHADLPGLTKEDVKVEVTHDELTIEGERKLEKEEKLEGVYRRERNYGRFLRRIPIPEHVRAEEAVATFRNGVLEVEMPTIPLPAAQKRTVEVRG
jgi:HSP20 family protein